MLALLGNAVGPFWGFGFEEVAIQLVVLAAIVAVVYIALRQFGITIPPWMVQIFWVLVVAVVAILAIRFLMTL